MRHFRRALRYLKRSNLRGTYPTWEAAERASTGYGLRLIVDRVAEAEWRVVNGEAAFQRDSVCFEETEYNWPVLGSLLLAASAQGTLRVLDVGGGLGSVFRQHAGALNGLVERWDVVEQPEFVAVGLSKFATGPVGFHASVESASVAGRPNLVLLSSTLQYLRDPEDCLRQISALDAPWIVVDRTPVFTAPKKSRIAVEHVAPSIYAASYPSWIFSWQDLEKWVARPTIVRWHNSDAEGWDYRYEGFVAAPPGRDARRGVTPLFRR